MIKSWAYLVCLSGILLFSCEDIPELIYNQVPVTVHLSATASDFEKFDIDFQKVKINNEGNEIDTASIIQAGVYDMTKWVTEKKLIGEFIVSYDTVQQVEIYLGIDNMMIKNGQSHGLPIINNQSSFIIPIGIYIQDKTELEIHLELNSEQSIVEVNGQYILDPKLILKN